jgi:hypothetical protein
VVTTIGEFNKKDNRPLDAFKIIRKHFNTRELLQILTSNFFSILYYNSNVWMLSNRTANLKRSLLSTSAVALKMALHYPCTRSITTLHGLK